MGGWLDLILVLVALVMAGHAGFYARGAWEDYKMRRLLVRIHADLNERIR